MSTIKDETYLLSFSINNHLLNKALYETIEQIKILSEQMALINRTLIAKDNNAVSITGIQEKATENERKRDAGSGIEGSFGKYHKIATSAGAIAKIGLNAYTAVKKLTPALKKVKTGIEALNGGLKAVAGIETLADATEIAEGMTAIANIVAGAEGFITASAAFGPEGPPAAASIVALAGELYVSINAVKGKRNREANFSEKGLKNGDSSISATKDAEARADLYIQKTIPSKETVITKLRDDLRRQGRVIKFDWLKAEAGDDKYLPALVAAINVNDALKNKRITQLAFGAKEDQQAFHDRFDKLHHFPTVVDPTVNVASPNQKNGFRFGFGPGPLTTDSIPFSQKEYERRHYSQPAKAGSWTKTMQDAALKTMVVAYQTNGFGYVHKEYLRMLQTQPDSKSPVNTVWNKFLTVKRQLDQEPQLKNSELTAPQRTNDFTPATRPSITINLNKPMIGNFTISVRDVKDGMNDFKHKVEEVLLEILNSANVIQ